MTTHSMRSAASRLPPAGHELGSGRGTYPENFSNTALAPGTHSFWTKRIGPEPIRSLICLKASIAAIRSGMMKQQGVALLPSASSIRGNGFFKTQRKVRSSTAPNSCSIALIIRPS